MKPIENERIDLERDLNVGFISSFLFSTPVELRIFCEDLIEQPMRLGADLYRAIDVAEIFSQFPDRAKEVLETYLLDTKLKFPISKRSELWGKSKYDLFFFLTRGYDKNDPIMKKYRPIRSKYIRCKEIIDGAMKAEVETGLNHDKLGILAAEYILKEGYEKMGQILGTKQEYWKYFSEYIKFIQIGPDGKFKATKISQPVDIGNNPEEIFNYMINMTDNDIYDLGKKQNRLLPALSVYFTRRLWVDNVRNMLSNTPIAENQNEVMKLTPKEGLSLT